MPGYAETYRRSLEQPEEFWAAAAAAIDWDKTWDRVLDDSRPLFAAAHKITQAPARCRCGGNPRP